MLPVVVRHVVVRSVQAEEGVGRLKDAQPLRVECELLVRFRSILDVDHLRATMVQLT